MDIKKCDICKKEIKDKDKSVYVRFTFLSKADLCYDCGTPVLRFMKKNKFLNEKDIKEN